MKKGDKYFNIWYSIDEEEEKQVEIFTDIYQITAIHNKKINRFSIKYTETHKHRTVVYLHLLYNFMNTKKGELVPSLTPAWMKKKINDVKSFRSLQYEGLYKTKLGAIKQQLRIIKKDKWRTEENEHLHKRAEGILRRMKTIEEKKQKSPN